jgi:hypothetical protein
VKGIYNVTFIAPYWHMTTTIELRNDGSETHTKADAIGVANVLIGDACGFYPSNYATVDIDVEYVGEEQ